MAYKIYRTHYCGSAHRSYRTAAKCIFRRSTYQLAGDGPYAFIHKFRVAGQFRRHVRLCPSLEKAEEMAFRFEVPCSGTCIGHEVVIIAPLNQLVQE